MSALDYYNNQKSQWNELLLDIGKAVTPLDDMACQTRAKSLFDNLSLAYHETKDEYLHSVLYYALRLKKENIFIGIFPLLEDDKGEVKNYATMAVTVGAFNAFKMLVDRILPHDRNEIFQEIIKGNRLDYLEYSIPKLVTTDDEMHELLKNCAFFRNMPAFLIAVEHGANPYRNDYEIIKSATVFNRFGVLEYAYQDGCDLVKIISEWNDKDFKPTPEAFDWLEKLSLRNKLEDNLKKKSTNSLQKKI